jgi:hypothetical protein
MLDKEAIEWYLKKPRKLKNKEQQSLYIIIVVPPKRVLTKILFNDKYIEMMTQF